MLTDILAQELANRAMSVIAYNVNVMNKDGIIIGSGDTARIGLLHEGALIAIERNGCFEISKKDAAKFVGVQPGINLAINFMGETVGVIGITGDPKEVGKYGELLKMVSELFLEHIYMQQKAENNKLLKDSALEQLLTKDSTDNKFLAKQIKFPYESKHLVIIISLFQLTDDMESIIVNLKKCGISFYLSGLNGKIVAILSGTAIKKIESSAEEINRCLTESGIKHYLVYGVSGDGGEGLRFSYQSCLDILQVVNIVKPKKNIISWGDISTEMAVFNMKNNWFKDELTQLWDKVKDKKLTDTFSVYIKNNGHTSATADALGVHRNTLFHRLSKIHKLTGKDPMSFKDLFVLYLSYKFNIEK